MLVVVDRMQFNALVAEKEQYLFSLLQYGNPFLASIYTKWIAELESAAICILMWLAGRTFVQGRAGVQVSLKDFTKAQVIEDKGALAPIGMCRNTLRKHLGLLTEDNFLHVYCLREVGNSRGDRAKLYEINFKKVITYDFCAPQIHHHVAQIEQRVVEERQVKTPKNAVLGTLYLEGGGQRLDTSPIYITYIDCIYSDLNRLDKSNQFNSAVFDTPRTTVDLSKKLRVAEEPVLKSISIPKKARVITRRPEAITDVIATAKIKRVAATATRMAEASAGVLTADSLQTALDKAMETFHPELPRLVVTAKAFGVLRKRMASAKVRDLVDFVNFSIREWTILAGRNRAAFLRNPARAKGSSPLSASPTFLEFAYRLPYFIAAYSQTLSTVASGKERSSKDDEVAKLEAKLKAAERENQNNRAIIRRVRQTQAPGGSPTGRTTSSEPQIQSILPRTIEGAKIRAAFARNFARKEAARGDSLRDSLDDWSKLIDTWAPPVWQDKAKTKK